jgi:hypothetical protein
MGLGLGLLDDRNLKIMQVQDINTDGAARRDLTGEPPRHGSTEAASSDACGYAANVKFFPTIVDFFR